MHASVIYVRNCTDQFKRRQSLFKGGGYFVPAWTYSEMNPAVCSIGKNVD